MSFKRKRSDAAFLSPAGSMTTSFTQFNDCHSTMPLFFPQSKPGDTTRLETSRNWKLGTEEESSHLNSRTRKRYRDNRPDEAQVHVATMKSLFDAQRQHPNASPVPSQSQSTRLHQTNQKSTLHSFWQLPKANGPSAVTPMDTTPLSGGTLGPTCDDCDRPLLSSDAMDLDEGMLEEEVACRACGKRVCDMCAIMGDERRCLECATC